jgi:hypothetical protein
LEAKIFSHQLIGWLAALLLALLLQIEEVALACACLTRQPRAAVILDNSNCQLRFCGTELVESLTRTFLEFTRKNIF